MEFDELILARYATKEFRDRELETKKLEQLVDMVRYAPSSMNLQPWRIKIIKSDKIKQQLFKYTHKQMQVITCSHLLVFCAETDTNRLIKKLAKKMESVGIAKEDVKTFSNMVREFVDKMSEEERKCWVQKQVYIGLSNALNGAKSLGFDSCPIEGFDAKAYSEILKLPKTVIPTVLCAVGYRDDRPAPKVRFDRKDILV